MTTKDKALQLQKILNYEGTELGEVWEQLIDLYLYKDGYITDEFHLQLGVELEIQYQDALDMIDDGDLEIPEDVIS
jgi:hypothetical protein